MPLAGDASLALFVADANRTSIEELTRQEFNFDVDASAGLELRVTLSWIDPAASSQVVTQLVHDLDLAVISPTGVRHTMWDSGETDLTNVNERVIVDAGDVETGTWSAWVWAKQLNTDEQSYSLVVNGAISPATDIGAIERSSSSYSASSADDDDDVAGVISSSSVSGGIGDDGIDPGDVTASLAVAVAAAPGALGVLCSSIAVGFVTTAFSTTAV